ncbi:glutathione S-transferase N-terminal domain-containing protein [Sorangium sp. So ce321]|uniref:glutathione S-transferase family protein n=1 Tax=Sorangium sp. So ce321 TaxID=3133300 RepID=UPI003F614EB6
MKIYGNPMSTCTQKALIVLAEKGHDAQLVTVDLMKGEQKQPEHLARHPFGVVPVLDDDGFILFESRAIMRYLDQSLSGLSLTPGDPKGRGLMEQWISAEQSYFSPHVLKIMYQCIFGPMRGTPPDQAIVDQAKSDIKKAFGVADTTLAKQEYFVGSGFSLADVTWMPYMQYLFIAGVGDIVAEHQHVNAWWKRASARPSWVKVARQASPQKS